MKNEVIHLTLHPFDLNNLKEKFLARKQTIIFCFCTVYFWGLLAHAYGFLHSNFSHDVLNAFLATAVEDNVKLEVGRYLVPVYRMLFRGPVTLPWVIGLLGLFWTAIALILVVRMFNIRSRMLMFLIGGMMTTNITYTAQIATFMHEFDCNAFAMLMAVLSVYLWSRDKKYLPILLGGLCLMASISIYQAYFAVAVTLIVWKSIMDLLDDAQVPKVFFKGIRGIVMLGMGCLFYLLLGKLTSYVTQLPLYGRANALDMGGQSPLVVYAGLIKPVISYLGRNILHKVFYSSVFDSCVYLLVALLALLAVRLIVVKKYRFDRILLIALLVAVIPLAMSCVFFLAKGNEMHDVTTYVLWFFYVFLLMLAFRLCEKDGNPDWKTGTVRAAVCILVGVVLWQNVVFANMAYMKKDMEAKATLSTVTRVVARLEDREDYDPKETTIAFMGVPNNQPYLEGIERFDTIIGLTYRSSVASDTAITHYNTYKAYFNYVLQTPARFCSDEMHRKLRADERVQAMPEYPHKDCMAIIDDVLVIKMGQYVLD